MCIKVCHLNFKEINGQCNYKRFGLAGFEHTQKDAYRDPNLKGGAVPPTDPVGLEPTKPGEATAECNNSCPAAILKRGG